MGRTHPITLRVILQLPFPSLFNKGTDHRTDSSFTNSKVHSTILKQRRFHHISLFHSVIFT